MSHTGTRNCLAIDKEYGIGCAAGPVFSVLNAQEFFSHVVKSSRERAPLSHFFFSSLAFSLQA